MKKDNDYILEDEYHDFFSDYPEFEDPQNWSDIKDINDSKKQIDGIVHLGKKNLDYMNAKFKELEEQHKRDKESIWSVIKFFAFIFGTALIFTVGFKLGAKDAISELAASAIETPIASSHAKK